MTPLRIPGPLNQDELNQLSIFNAEKYRGLTHTKEWCERMAMLQEAFNEHSFIPEHRSWIVEVLGR
jgi:hypothetical protein